MKQITFKKLVENSIERIKKLNENNITVNENTENNKFEVGKLYRGWSNSSWTDPKLLDLIVVYISPDRSYLLGTRPNFSHPLEARKYKIINDVRFGEKLKENPTRGEYEVWRADKGGIDTDIPDGWFDVNKQKRLAISDKKKILKQMQSKITTLDQFCKAWITAFNHALELNNQKPNPYHDWKFLKDFLISKNMTKVEVGKIFKTKYLKHEYAFDITVGNGYRTIRVYNDRFGLAGEPPSRLISGETFEEFFGPVEK